MAASEVIGNLAVIIGADISGLQKGVADTKKELSGLQGGLGSLVSTLAKVTAAAVAAGAAIVLGLTDSGLKSIDAQSKLARQLGGTVLGVQALIETGKLAGLAQDSLTQSVNRLNSKLGEAIRDGMSPAADALRRLGLNAADLSKLDIDTRMAMIADAIQRLGFNSSQTSDLLQQLGIRGGKITELMMAGGDAFREARLDVVAFGAAVSEIDGRKIEIANDAWTKLQLLLDGIKNQLALFAAPILTDLAKQIEEAGKEGQGFGVQVQSAIAGSVVAAGYLLNLFHYLDIGIQAATVAALGLNAAMAKAATYTIDWSDKAKAEAAVAVSAFEAAKKDLDILFNEKLPSTNIEDYLARVKAAADAAAAAMSGGGPKGPAGGESLSSKEIKQYQEKLQRLKESVASEDAVLDLQEADRLKKLDEYGAKLGLSDQATNALRDQIRQKHDLDLKNYITTTLEANVLTEQEISKRQYDNQLLALQQYVKNHADKVQWGVDLEKKIRQQAALDQLQITSAQYSGLASIVDTSMSAISGIVADESQKGFTVMKAISMATALVKGFEATVSAYAFGAKIGGPPLGIAMAAVAAAGTAAIIAKLAGVGPNSGGTTAGAASDGGGAASAATATAAQGPSANQTLTVQGINKNSLFTGDAVRTIAKALVAYQRDGGTVVLA